MTSFGMFLWYIVTNNLEVTPTFLKVIDSIIS